MKDSKIKAEESNASHTLGYTTPVVIHTQVRQFRRGRQSLPGCVSRTDVPVYMCERGGGRRGSCALRNAISAAIHTQIRQFRRGRQRLPGCVARTDAPVSSSCFFFVFFLLFWGRGMMFWFTSVTVQQLLTQSDCVQRSTEEGAYDAIFAGGSKREQRSTPRIHGNISNNQ